MAGHTKGPLVLGKKGMGVIKGGPMHEYTNGSAQSQLFLAMVGQDMPDDERDANAAHLIKCWNLHYELLKSLRELRTNIMHDAEYSSATRHEFEEMLNEADRVLAEADAPC
ncbi:hypothetical protein SB778_03900 [Paraburkholderia sp. SIMBA_050]